jgi:hypothetical protein
MGIFSIHPIKAFSVSGYLALLLLSFYIFASADDFNLHCYPNPADLDGIRLTIAFNLPVASTVTLEIYTIEGYKLKTILNEANVDAAKVKRALWGYKDEAGEKVNPGVYVAVLRVNNSDDGEKNDKFVFILE